MTAIEALIKILKEGTNSIGNWDTVTAAIAPIDDSDTSNAIRVSTSGSAAQAIRNAAEEAANEGHNAILFPPGDWYVDPDDLALEDEEGYIALIPSNFRVIGQPGSRIIQQGLGDSPDGESPFYHIFRCNDGTSNVIFDGLTIEGEKPGASYTYNHQSTGIDILLTNSTDIMVRNCRFLNLWGFSVHDRGGNNRIHAVNNYMYRCSNGLNICADYSIQAYNTIIESEGIEFSGAYCSVVHNKLIDALGVGISAGGNLLLSKPGSRVDGNIITGCVEVSGQFGIGIIAAENFCHGSISNNYIRNCDYHGIVLNGHAGIIGVQIHDNQLYSNGLVGNGGIGIDVQSNSGRHSIRGNKSRDLADAGYSQSYGLLINAPDCRVQDNDFKGTNHDASYSNSALRTIERNNRYENSNQEKGGSATFTDVSYAWRA